MKKSIVVIAFLTVIALMAGCLSLRVISEQYKYDSEGRLICKIAPDRGKTTYKYNNKGLLTEVRYPGGWVRYGYDENGNRIWMKDKTGTTQYYYDAFDRLIGVISKHSPWRLIVYDYDPWGYLTYMAILNLHIIEQEIKYKEMLRELEVSSVERTQRWRDRELRFQQMIERLRLEDAGRKERWLEYEVKYRHDILGNLTSIDTKYGSINYFYHSDKGQIERRLPNGITTRFTYLPDGLLKSLRHESNIGQLIVEYQYDYSPAGKVINVHEITSEGLKTTRYTWDTRGYLKELHLPDGNKIQYDYDTMGNRILKQDAKGILRYKYDNFGRLIQAGNLRCEWDRNGNLISQMERQNKTRIRYDGRGLATTVRIPDATIRYEWDGDGNMISRRVGKEITYFLSNPLAPPGFTLAEFNNTGRLTTSYLYGDVLLGQQDINGQIRYFLEDGFNSIRHIVDMNGKTVGQRDYTPFGEPITTKGDIPVNFRMMGERFLPEIRSYAIGGRIYNPKVARYFTPDPLPGYMERFDSFNKYAHGSNISAIFMEPRCNQTLKFPSTLMPRLSWFQPSRNIPDLERYGLYNPFRHPLRAIWDLGFLPAIGKVPSIVKVPSIMSQWQRALRGEAVNITLPVSTSYILGGILAEGWRSLFSTGLGLHHAPLVSMNLILLPVLYGYWNFVFSTLEEANRQFQEALLRNYFPSDLYDIDISRDENKLTMRIKRGGFKDPFRSFENQLGGIELAAPGEFIGNLGTITGAVFDPERQCLVLVAEKNPSVSSIKPEDLAVALMCVFGPIPQDPQFSLDPYNPRNPKGKWLKSVYIPEEIIGGTEFGKTLFEADWLLKQYSLGVMIDENGKLRKRKSSVYGFKSTADLSLEEQGGEIGKERWARFWIVSDDMKLKQFGKSIYFDVAKMGVKAKKQVIDPSSPTGLRDVDTEDDPIATKFANLFTELYDEIAKESPEFERVRELAKAVAIAKWIKRENIPVNMDWVFEYANKRIKTIGKIPAISVKWQKQNQEMYSEGGRTGIQTTIHQLHLFGGVDLTVNPRYIPDDGIAQDLQEAVRSKLREKDIGSVFTIKHRGKSLLAAVLPIARSEQEMQKNSSSRKIDGIVYQFNNQREVTKSIDRNGNITEYIYDSNRKLKTVKRSNGKGWKAIGERDGAGSLWTVTNPKGNTLRYKYGSSGYLNEIEVNGRKWATYQYDPKERQIVIRYNGYSEKIVCEASGNIKEYEIQTEKNIPSSPPRRERLIFDYNKFGKLTKITGTQLPWVDISYAEDGSKPAVIATPQAEIRFSYDPDGRLKRTTHSNGLLIAYAYDDNQLTRLQVNYQGRQAEYQLNRDGIIQSRDLLGGEVDYGYTNGRLSSTKLSEYGEARYVYDSQNRLCKIHFPDGSFIEYHYKEEKGRKKRNNGSKGEILIELQKRHK